MLAEGASVAIHELRNLQEEAKGAVEDCETTQTATKQYGSAAAFLGFRSAFNLTLHDSGIERSRL
jgi:hypothetical protein